MQPSPHASTLELPSPFDRLLGLAYHHTGGDRVVAELEVTPALLQPTGIVHGGVYAAMVESATSVGASLWLEGDGWAAGIGNHTEFLHACRKGVLRVEATPVQRGRSTQLWQATVTDGDGRPVAQGQVRLMNMRRPTPERSADAPSG